MSTTDCKEIRENIKYNRDLPYIRWQSLDKGKYLLLYTTIPCFYLCKIRAKTLIPGVNPCLESDVFIFETLEQAEKFFNKITEAESEEK